MDNITDDDRRYIEYLNEVWGDCDHGLLLFKGDPIAFEIGREEWLREQEVESFDDIEQELNELGFTLDAEDNKRVE